MGIPPLGASRTDGTPEACRDGQAQLLLSIAAVSEACVRSHTSAQGRDETLTCALAAVTALVHEHHEARASALAQANDSIHHLSRTVLSSLPALPRAPKRDPLLRLIDRHFSENLHSDFLASLLRTSSVGGLAQRLFAELHALGSKSEHPEVNLDDCVFCTRELRLDQLDPSMGESDLEARRIDLLASQGDRYILIESKVWTGESESQTVDYANALEHALGERQSTYLMLSPTGQRAADPRFHSLSFIKLAEVLARVDDDSAGVLTQYRAELEEIFVAPRRQRIETTRSLLGMD